MDARTDENLQEFSEPLLKKSQKPIVKPKRTSKTAGTHNNNNNTSNNKTAENKGLRYNASTYSIVPISEVTQGAVEVWATLPDEIRQDPSLASFRQEHERIHGKLFTRSTRIIPILFFNGRRENLTRLLRCNLFTSRQTVKENVEKKIIFFFIFQGSLRSISIEETLNKMKLDMIDDEYIFHCSYQPE